MYDSGGHIAITPLFTSDEIPTDIDEAVIFLSDKYDAHSFFTTETDREIYKYLESKFTQDSNVIRYIIPKLSDAIVMVVVGLLRNSKNDSSEWKENVLPSYEDIVDIQLCRNGKPNYNVITGVINAVSYDDRLILPVERVLSLAKKLVTHKAKFGASEGPLPFPNHWGNIFVQIYDLYIKCLVKNAVKKDETDSRISDEDKACFIDLLLDDENEIFKYVVSEHIDDIKYLDNDMISDNLGSVFMTSGSVNPSICLIAIRHCRYVYSEIAKFFVDNNVFVEILRNGILEDKDVKVYGYHKDLISYVIAIYSFEYCDFSTVNSFIEACPTEYYGLLVERTTSQKTSSSEVHYEEVFHNVFDAVLAKSKGNDKILHDVCCSAMSIYRVVDEPSDDLFGKIEFCIEHIDGNKLYWNQLISLFNKYQAEHLYKMIGCITKFIRKTRSIDYDDTTKIIDGLVAINQNDVAIEVCNIYITKGFRVNEFATKLRELTRTN